MEKQDSFDKMVGDISVEERRNILNQMQSTASLGNGTIHPVDEILTDSIEPFEVCIKKEPVFVRFIIWLKSVLSNTTQATIYNEHKLSEISHYINRNFPGLINAKQGFYLSSFYDRISELKSVADFFKPYLISLDEITDGPFYVFLSSFIMPEINEEIKTNADPYSNLVTAVIKPDTRSTLIKNLEDIFDSIPQDDKSRMYTAAKASEWLKQFIRLPFARIITLFSNTEGKGFTCQFSQIDAEIDTVTRILSSSVDIPDEFLQALCLFAVRNSKKNNAEENARNAGDFLEKAHSNINLLQMFMSNTPLRSIECIVHDDFRWRTGQFSGGEDWFVKYKNTCKKIFEQKWAAWESECKKEALISTLKSVFKLDSFPLFPLRPWDDGRTNSSIAYDTTLGFLNWFIKDKFSACEMDLKNLLMQGTFSKQENYNALSESFGDMVQLSISLQDLERKLTPHGEFGSVFQKVHDDQTRTLQAQGKVEHIKREIENEIKSLLHRFCDSARTINQVLTGALGLSKDSRFDTISNLSKLKDKNNEPFFKKAENAQKLFESALNLIIELEPLDQYRAK